MKTFTVRVTATRLNELRMLADWQLRELGFDPASVTAACQGADNPRHGYSTKWNPFRDEEWNNVLSNL